MVGPGFGRVSDKSPATLAAKETTVSAKAVRITRFMWVD